MPTIAEIRAREILDSRGRPTIEAACRLDKGILARASVPSGASTGASEAHELRDGGTRYGGLGCRLAVRSVVEVIAPAMQGRAFESQKAVDDLLLGLDGTSRKERLGANAILAVSLAFARACAAGSGLPLYRYLADLDSGRKGPPGMPKLTVNLFSGGKHAGGQVGVQDVLLAPRNSGAIDSGLSDVYAVYAQAVRLCAEKYRQRPLKADEGGLAPPFDSEEAMLADAVEAIRRAAFEPGGQMGLAVDVASSHFYRDGRYQLGGRSLTTSEMIDLLTGWTVKYPVLSVEDGLAESDWEGWPRLRAALSPAVLVLGDDLLCTNPALIDRAVAARACDALLLKVNQIGTLSEAADAARRARRAGWTVVVSARSGETEDNWLADLAVAWGDQIKVGSITQSDRLSKYNRLLEIEAELQGS